MKKIIFLGLILSITFGTLTTTTQCTCDQLMSQGDCERQLSLSCKWDDTKKACSKDTTTPAATTYKTYCEAYNQTDCPQKDGCLWLDSCTHFTGCTAFKKTTDQDCNAISKKCKTDGTHCVEISTCSSYLKMESCTKNQDGKYCFWDTSVTPNGCIDASKCEHYPSSLTTDEQCRAAQSFCTAKTGGGCQDSGTSCSDQPTDLQCKWNYTMQTKCFWDTSVTPNVCKDKTCENAPKSFVTDDQCIGHDPTCTTAKDGGCVLRSTCELAQNSAACKTNVSGGPCYYTSEGKCVTKDCSVAPISNTTNPQCAAWVTGCITKKDGGCKSNGACSVADIDVACSVNNLGGACVWNNGKCLDKTCTNAPSTYNSHQSCSGYSDKCTVNATNNGCADRTCSNAPKDITTNSACNTYKSGCITKKDGGCRDNSNCSDFDIDIACESTIDSIGNKCFWDSTATPAGCFAKICANAPSASRVSHSACNTFLPNCTVNKDKNACIEMTCENIYDKDDCKTDKDQNPCLFKATCFQKQCSQALDSVTTHAGCQLFMNSCTVDNDGKGCMMIPPACSVIKTQEGCVKTSQIGYNECDWSSNKCVDKICSTAPQSIVTNDACNAYKTGCLVANTEKGCLDPITTACTSRVEVNCYATVGFKCLYDSTSKCIARTCSTASQSTITTVNGKLQSFSNNDCGTYLDGCVLGNDGNSCMSKATACSSYTRSDNCGKGLLNGNACYWNSSDSTCVDKQCANVKLTNHSDCNNAITNSVGVGQCTYGTATNCAALQDSCGSYTEKACYVTSAGKNCIWTNNACREKTCTDATDTADFNTNSECQSLSSTCIVIDKVDNAGCMALLPNCSSYTNSAQCVITLNGLDCYWLNNSCILKSQLCSQIVLQTYETSNCEAVSISCRANQAKTACVDKVCGDITSQVSDSTCKAYLSNCTNKMDNSVCIVKPNLCAGQTQDSCTNAVEGPCTWSSPNCTKSVSVAFSSCTNKTGTDLTWANCQSYDSTCTVNLKGDSCIPNQSNCSGFDVQAKCRQYSATNFCKWDPTGAGACVAQSSVVCTDVVAATGGLTFGACQAFSSTCTVNKKMDACVLSYNCAILNKGVNCYRGLDGLCFETNTSCVAVTSSNCNIVVQGSGSALTFDNCQQYNTACIANVDGSACMLGQASCGGYNSQTDCLTTTNKIKCYWTTACIAITPSDCQSVVQGSGSALTNDLCSSYNSACIANYNGSTCIQQQSDCTSYTSLQSCFTTSTNIKCYWDTTAPPSCIHITSANCNKIVKGATNLVDTDCQSYSTDCTVNSDGSACKPLESTCSLTTVQTACARAQEGDCVWVAGTSSGLCVKKTCDTAAPSITTHNGCQSYLSTCTVARVGGCIAKTDCNKYKSKTQCQNGGNCFWNERLSNTCVDLSCATIEDAYNTDVLCSGISGLKCTVKATGKGCQNRTACNLYGISDQCKFDSNNKPCVWQTVGSTCVDKSCATSTASTHTNCYSYITSSNYADLCTVAYVSDTAQGCQKVSACASYQYEGQCVVDEQGQNCVWSNPGGQGTCAIKTCTTAAVSDQYDTNDECTAYINDGSCTVSSTGQGCIVRPNKCDGMTQEQCHYTSDGTVCEWFGGACVLKSCGTAPETVTTAEGCNTYLAGCTMEETNKCRTLLCEDFNLATDFECEKAKKGCTTNGINCVKRDICQAANKPGCVTQIGGALCQWIESSSICVVRTCGTAPTTDDYITESQCQAYLPECTANLGKGCVTKTTCTAAKVESACTIDQQKVKCVWDNGNCRYQQCSDFSGTTHQACQAFLKQTCTAGQNGKCTELGKCEQVTVRQGCIEGTDGPCLWISGYNNRAGACFQHYSCKSRNWNDHDQCQWISKQCTTNGTNCLAITSCSETNITGGCKIGYDGQCMQTVSSLGAFDTACKAFDKCENAFYLTHDECQKANKKCTTNGKTSCAPLDACSKYTVKEACQINASGALNDTNGAITLTGVCKWDDATSTCADQKCVDLQGSSHQQCASQLKGCTTDGLNCQTQAACSVYTLTSCEIAYGTDGLQGKCKWDTTTTKCRPFVCGDIADGKTTIGCQAVLTSCVSGGSVCTLKDKCSVYVTKTSCNSGGTDGVCVFKASTVKDAPAGSGTCSLMTNCSSASSDSSACKQFPKKCLFTDQITSGTTTTPSKCEDITTCAMLQKASNTCDNFLNWAGNQQQLCETTSLGCTELDVSKLTDQTCYSKSTAYTYSWSVSKTKCTICSSTTNNTTVINQTGNDNTTTGSDYILSFAIVILGYLVL